LEGKQNETKSERKEKFFESFPQRFPSFFNILIFLFVSVLIHFFFLRKKEQSKSRDGSNQEIKRVTERHKSNEKQLIQ